MGAIGWIWAGMMLMGGVRAHFAHGVPAALVWAMLVSGTLALPVLWSRDDGLFGSLAPMGAVRAGLALLVLIVAGIGHPTAVMGLIPA